ncbi:MAG: amylo-alpha-1,6-glucosidase [Bacteroidota bacterium]
MRTDEEIREAVRDLMFNNIKAGLSPYLGKHYCYVMPSPSNYPFQWWWDTCFSIFILCALGEYTLARQNLRSLFAMQEKDGYVGHMIFWESLLPNNLLTFLQGPPAWRQIRPHMSSLVQPPLVAQALERMFEISGDRECLQEMIPKIKKYFQWLIENRDFDGDGLISIISTFESGIDWKPSFDEVLGFETVKATEKYFWKNVSVELRNFLRWYNAKRIYKANVFIVKEVLFNTMFVQDLRALGRLCREIEDADSEKYEALADRAAKRMMQIMYDDETAAFYDVYGHDNKKLKVLTFTIAVPIMMNDVPKEIAIRILRRHFFNQHEFDLKYPIPSVAKSEPSFCPYESKFLWRGPTWVVSNWLLYNCLLHKGFTKEADKILSSVKNLIELSGFREYYNPFTGEGYGAKDFTWSGLIVDMFRLKNEFDAQQSLIVRSDGVLKTA